MAQKLTNFPEVEAYLTPDNNSRAFAGRVAELLWRLVFSTFGTAAQKNVAGTLQGDNNDILTLGLVGDCVGRDVGDGVGELVDNQRLDVRINERFSGNQGNLKAAAFKAVGIAAGNLAELNAQGKFPASVIPNPQGGITVAEINGAGISDGTDVIVIFAEAPVMASLNSFQLDIPAGGETDYFCTWNLAGRNFTVRVEGPRETAFTFVATGLVLP